MAQQCGSHFERDAELLKPGGRGMAQIVGVEINDFRLGRESLPEDAEHGRSPSSEGFPVQVSDRPA